VISCGTLGLKYYIITLRVDMLLLLTFHKVHLNELIK